MKVSIPLIICALLSCSMTSATPLPSRADGYAVRVTDIYDGDTFTIDGEQWSPFPHLTWKVRIRGIDTPEKRSRCSKERSLAIRAKNKLVELLKGSQRSRGIGQVNWQKGRVERGYFVWLSEVDHDKYGGRFDAVVTLADGTSLGDRMIASGLARPYFGGKKVAWCNNMVAQKRGV